jgi:ABC-type lipoprotein release transport system permease subunit
MNVVRIASRNVVRYWHRTLVTTLAMAFAGFIMILFASLLAGMIQASERNAVIMNVGDFQIHAKGYRDDPDLYNRIRNYSALIEQISAQGFFATPRLYGVALAASGTASSGVQLRGVYTDLESTVTQLHKHVMAGVWLDKKDPAGVVIGKKLARTLGVKMGDEIVIIGQASDGSMANELYYVRGILKSVSTEIDQAGFFMLADSYRELMALYEGVHEIVIMRPDRRADLYQAHEKIKSIASEYEVLNWEELQPVIARILGIMGNQIFVMMFITYIAVAMVVLNAMLMSVFERIHEFGIMKAIGVTPRQLVLLIYIETLIQAASAAILALVFGYLAADYFQTHGLDLSNIASGAVFGGIAMDPIWYAHVTTETLVTPVVFLFLMSLIAVIYPAIKAAVIEPVKAIYYR